MSYSNGIEAMAGRGRDASSVSGIITTRNEVKWYLDQTNADVDNFLVDVGRWFATNKAPDDQLIVERFKVFFNRWKKFYEDARGRFPRNEIIEQTANWRRRLINWRRAFVARGMKPTTPDPELPPQKAPWIHGMLIAAGGAVLGGYLTEKLIRRRK